WLPAGNAGDAHLRELKQLAVAAGMKPPFFTATAWGGAAVPADEVLPLWGGYAFWPWIFFGDATEHPATPEFLFRDYHNNQIPHCYNFEPGYVPEELPYACCEMGGGMAAYYKYRFQLPSASVSAMSLVKTAGGCNFVGYYMYHGGTNPRGKVLPFLNEHALPKLSYDYQAPIGEFGQLREHYHRLRLLHYFYRDFAGSLCRMETVLPSDATDDPYDTETLRYAVRARDNSGYLFLNNYQDHVEQSTLHDLRIQLELKSETIVIPQSGGLTLVKDVSCILPFNLDLSGVRLKYATTQLITQIEYQGEIYYFFFIPAGMKGEYCFKHQGISEFQVEHGQSSTIAEHSIVTVSQQQLSQIRITTATGAQIRICTLPESQALRFWKVDLWGRERVLITEAAVIVPNEGQQLRLEVTGRTQTSVSLFPAPEEQLAVIGGEMVEYPIQGIFKDYTINLPERESGVQLIPKQAGKTVVNFNANTFTGLKELFLKVNYHGDVGNAFIDGELIHDNFSNGAPWEIGLAKHLEALVEKGMYIYIAPLKKGAYVKNDSTMAARSEVVETEIAEIQSIEAVPVCEVTINLR
ncbi:MAG TPA: beta-galactosidase, partial [Bacillota bacterium]|nr:beta-galactosidase [Bacillota bacterium]